MKNKLKLFSEFMATVGYCIKISWQSSRLYTAVRLLGKMITPILGIITAFLLKYIINLLSGAYVVADNRLALIVLLGTSVMISIVTAVIRKLISYAEGMHNDILERYITMGMMDKALNTDLEMFDNPTFYDKFTSVRRDSYATTYILWNILDCVSSFVAFAGAFMVLCSSNWLYGIIMVAAAFPSAIVSQKYTKILYQLGLTQVNDERKKGYFYEVASNKMYPQDVRLFKLGNMLKQRYSDMWGNIFSAKKRKIKSRTILTTLLEILPELVIGFITIDISFKVLGASATVGDYSLYTGLLGQLLSAIFMLTNSAVNIYENKLKIDNVKSFDGIKNRVQDSGKVELKSVDTIEFSHVYFSYPQTDKQVLIDLNFAVNKGEKLAVVGVNGAGKTTLIKLLLRFYDVDSGAVRINNIDIREYTVDSLHKCFSCYFQNTPNYGFTVRENITIADLQRKYSDTEVLDALDNSDADGILAKADNGLDTYLTRYFDDNGMELSGGQNQKIALARTFYRNSSAIILDEPSSNLDPEAEHRLFESLQKLCDNKTTIFTSHRLSNIVLADRIVVIENGQVVEIGTKEELLKNPKRFAVLYQYQAEKFQ